MNKIIKIVAIALIFVSLASVASAAKKPVVRPPGGGASGGASTWAKPGALAPGGTFYAPMTSSEYAQGRTGPFVIGLTADEEGDYGTADADKTFSFWVKNGLVRIGDFVADTALGKEGKFVSDDQSAVLNVKGKVRVEALCIGAGSDSAQCRTTPWSTSGGGGSVPSVTVSASQGGTAAATITGAGTAASPYNIAFVLPRGANSTVPGPAPTITASAQAGASAGVTVTGSNPYNLAFTIPAGSAGTNGKTILSGTGAPSGGAVGDYYYKTSDNTFWGPKTSSGWPTAGVSLVGPAGQPGAAGVSSASVPLVLSPEKVLSLKSDTCSDGGVWTWKTSSWQCLVPESGGVANSATGVVGSGSGWGFELYDMTTNPPASRTVYNKGLAVWDTSSGVPTTTLTYSPNFGIDMYGQLTNNGGRLALNPDSSSIIADSMSAINLGGYRVTASRWTDQNYETTPYDLSAVRGTAFNGVDNSSKAYNGVYAQGDNGCTTNYDTWNCGAPYSEARKGYDFYGAGPRTYFKGNVGIGKLSPSTALEVLGTASSSKLTVSAVATTTKLVVLDTASIANTLSAGKIISNFKIGVLKDPQAQLDVLGTASSTNLVVNGAASIKGGLLVSGLTNSTSLVVSGGMQVGTTVNGGSETHYGEESHSGTATFSGKLIIPTGKASNYSASDGEIWIEQ